MASATPDLRLPSRPQSITALWPVPNCTAWWQRHMGVSNLPRVVVKWCAGWESNMLITPPPSHHNILDTHTKFCRQQQKLKKIIKFSCSYLTKKWNSFHPVRRSARNQSQLLVIKIIAWCEFSYRVATLQSWSNSPTFPDISSDYLRGIDPLNSSNKKRNACYFMTFLRQLCSM